MSSVVNQVSDGVVPRLDDLSVKNAYLAYKKAFDRYPKDNEDLNIIQMTALHHCLLSVQVPYVHFALWCPHACKVIRMLKLSGMQLMPGGELRSIEILGLPSSDVWEKCYALLLTELVMVEALGYHDKIKRYVAHYGNEKWLLIYQCDMQTRPLHREVEVEEPRRLG